MRHLQLTADLAAAFLRHNIVATVDVSELIKLIYAALADTALPVPSAVDALVPFVSIKKSISADAIICLECGKAQKMAKRHLQVSHGLSPDEYRAKWSLPANYPMVAPNYAKTRSQLAIDSGLGRKTATVGTDEPVSADTVEQPREKYPPSRWSKPKQ